MEKTERLKNRYRAIKEIKDRYYVGTKEAFDVVKDIEGVYSNPQEISDLINKRLGAFGKLTYQATPERVAGIKEVVDFVLDEIDSVTEFDPETHTIDPAFYLAERAEELNTPGSKVFGLCDPEFSIFYKKKSQGGGFISGDPEKAVDILTPFFASANANSVCSDDEFGNEFVKVIRMAYESISGQINPEETAPSCDSFIDGLKQGLSREDWNEFMSKERFYKGEAIALKYTSSGISTSKILERLLRDKVDNNWEYRRGTLCKFLQDVEPESYEEARALLKRQKAMRCNRLENLIGNDSPSIIINTEIEMIRSSNFLLHVLAQEKSFVERYLRN